MHLTRNLQLAIAAALALASAAAGTEPSPDGSEAITFSEHVAPILRTNCEGCHRAGQIGPMPLTDYQEARPWAKSIAKQVEARKMPPWFAHPDSRAMKGDLNLTNEEIELIVSWAKTGASEGDPKLLPAPREYTTYAGGWTLGDPDLVLSPAAPYLVGKEVDDEYRCYSVELGLPHDVWLKSAEFQPGNNEVVHHFILFGETTGVGKRMDDATPEPGWECGQMEASLAQAKVLEMWAPGNVSPFPPAGIATKVPSGSQLILQIHYHNVSGADQEDLSRFAMHLAQPDEIIQKELRGQLVSAWTLDIEAGDAHSEHTASWVADQDITLYTAGGHMHYRGKDIGMWATKPDGAKETLLWMPNYDFNWQLTYEFVDAYKAPKGTEFLMVSHHDNSENNPYNPVLPPIDVKWGLATSDEMSFTGFGYTIDDQQLGITPQVPENGSTPATGAGD